MIAWLTRHLQTLVGSLGRLVEQPLANLLTVLVIGIALALPTTLQVLVNNVHTVGGGWSQAISLSLYLKQGISENQAELLVQRLQKRHDIARLRLLKADDALKEFRQQSGFGDALKALEENPLPHTIVVQPSIDASSPASLDNLRAELQKMPEVDVVQLDTAWVKRLYTILDAVRRAVQVAGVLLGVAVTAVVGNTIRLDIQNRRDEIEITKLIGASNAFVRRPFLYSGVWYGLAGGVVAALLVALIVQALRAPISRIAVLYGSEFRLQGLGFVNSLALLAVGVALGWAGSFVTSTVHLRNIEPR